MGLIAESRGWWQRRRLAITCRAAVELVTDYLEGALAPADRGRFERHLRHCPPCVCVVEQLRATSGVLARLEPEGLDADTRDRLIDLYRTYRDS